MDSQEPLFPRVLRVFIYDFPNFWAINRGVTEFGILNTSGFQTLITWKKPTSFS